MASAGEGSLCNPTYHVAYNEVPVVAPEVMVVTDNTIALTGNGGSLVRDGKLFFDSFPPIQYVLNEPIPQNLEDLTSDTTTFTPTGNGNEDDVPSDPSPLAEQALSVSEAITPVSPLTEPAAHVSPSNQRTDGIGNTLGDDETLSDPTLLTPQQALTKLTTTEEQPAMFAGTEAVPDDTPSCQLSSKDKDLTMKTSQWMTRSRLI